jgi:uncharacterized Fe-S cluster protein YjdI
MGMKKEYKRGDLTVVWKPDLCFHSKNCVRGLPKVFNPNQKPWIQTEHASEQELAEVIDRCPSGALSYQWKGMAKNSNSHEMVEIETMKNGPVIVKGKVKLKIGGEEKEHDSEVTALCRCGASSKKPFCDGSHKSAGFLAD